MTAPSPAQAPVVMKFGGSSVADLDRLRDVASRVVERAKTEPVVVVVSAMGKTTNQLLADARALADPPPARELDMLLTTGERQSMALLAVAIARHGRRAMSLTGSQCGIITDHQHGRARIVEVRPFRIVDELTAGHIVIVGGFQGVSYKREVTTLGRGGSDTTAVALAAALGADCEIYSDVDGVYSADPREIEGARRLDHVSYEEMQALSRAGAKVLHAQAVELAAEREIAIYARRADGEGGETIVRKHARGSPGVRAVASDPSVARIRIVVKEDGWAWPASLAGRFGALGLRYLALDERGASGILGSQRTDVEDVLAEIAAIAEAIGSSATVDIRRDVALVTCVGAGLEERPELVAEALAALDGVDSAPTQIHTDTHCLAFVVGTDERVAAVQALHERFVESGYARRAMGTA